MSKPEEVYNINDELIDQNIELPAKSSKAKIAIAIIAGVLFVAATTVLLVGHFAFNWFKSETYKLNAHINRSIYQTNYFTETKKINSEYSFTNGNKEKKKAIVNTNFVVVLTDRKELAKDNFLNTATLVILNSKVTTDEEESELISFPIDATSLKELEKNPDSSKYPMAIFTFYEDGTIKEIKLPDNMDKYNADSIVELIQNVIPKLTRNRAEDISNGLEITEKTNNKIKTIVETISPRTYEDFQGSIFSKIVRREIEEEQITNVQVDTSAYFEEDDLENADFGIKDFLYKTNSEIKAVKTTENKETTKLVKEFEKKYKFIESKELIENILEQEKREQEIPIKIEDIEEEATTLRKLGFNFNVDKTYTIKTITFLKQTFSIKYRVAVSNGKAINQLIIDSKLGKATFGNGGVTYEVSKTWSGRIQVFRFTFPPFPVISLGVYAGGSLSFSIRFTTVDKTSLTLTLSGSITATAEIKAGWDKLMSFSAGAEGTIISASGYATVTKSGVSKGYKISGGKIVCYVVAKIFGKKVWKKSHTLFNGWST